MAGTAITYERDVIQGRSAAQVLVELTDDIRDIVTDLELIRVSVDVAENWILEVNDDLELNTRYSSTIDFAQQAADTGETLTFTATVANLGDFMSPYAHTIDPNDHAMQAYVQADDLGELAIWNVGTGTVDVSSTTGLCFSIPNAAATLTGVITAPVLSATALDAAGDLLGYNLTIS